MTDSGRIKGRIKGVRYIFQSRLSTSKAVTLNLSDSIVAGVQVSTKKKQPEQ